MDEFLKQFWPSVVPLFGGGSVFAFLMYHQRKRDAADRLREHQARMYELAYRQANAYARELANLAGPAAQAAMEGEHDMAMTYLRLIFSHMSEDTGDGARKLGRYPDFLKRAREEIDLTRLEEMGPDATT